MSSKIKIIYDWIGPTGPISNIMTPNLYNFASVMSDIHTDDHRKHLAPYSYQNFFLKFPDVFEISPSFSVTMEDIFIYELQMYHWVAPERFFSFNDIPGIIETSHISHHTLQCIINGNGYILIDNMFEAHVQPYFFSIMHNYFNNHNIPLNKIIYQVGAANAESLYNDFCVKNGIAENNRMNVIFWDMVEWNLSVFMNGKFKKLTTDKNIKDIKKIFLCFNRRYRTHRTKLLLLFKKFNLLNDSLYSMPFYNPDNSGDSFVNQVDWSFAQKINISKEEVNDLFKMMPLIIDNEKDIMKMIGIASSKTEHFYNQSLVAIVTETFFETNIISITEKSYKPIYYKQPFITVGAPYSLEYLRKKGYKTFSRWWDESYDVIENHDDRIIKIAEVCNTIKNWSTERRQKFIEESNEVLTHNLNTLLNRSTNIDDSFWLTLRK
jgi:hypothetical protein